MRHVAPIVGSFQHWLKGFQCLDVALEADGARHKFVCRRSLGNDCSDEVSARACVQTSFRTRSGDLQGRWPSSTLAMRLWLIPSQQKTCSEELRAIRHIVRSRLRVSARSLSLKTTSRCLTASSEEEAANSLPGFQGGSAFHETTLKAKTLHPVLLKIHIREILAA